MTALTIADRYVAQIPSDPAAGAVDFDDLVARYAKDLFRYAYWLCGDRQTAEDLTQETLLRAWKCRHQLNDEKAAKGWLLTILRRENARRFERARLPEADVPVERVGEPRPDYDTSTEAFLLRRALGNLPVEYREPLLLQVIYGYSQQEIADRLGLSSPGVGTRLFRARHKLREMLGSPGG